MQCSWGMNEKQNDQHRKDMKVPSEVLIQSCVVVVVVVGVVIYKFAGCMLVSDCVHHMWLLP